MTPSAKGESPAQSAAPAPVTEYAQSNGITIAYETFGDPGRPALLLIMGLGTQMVAWPEPLCRDLAGRGYFVIRFDNRDVGLSTHLDELPTPTTADLLARRRRPAYSIADMAADTAGLFDALGIDSAHVVGASMGGYIAQELALRHPDRVRSLTLIMTSTGSRRVGRPAPTLATRLLRRRGISGRDAAIDAAVQTFRVIGSPGFEFDHEWLTEIAAVSYDRAHYPRGYLRQLAASIWQPNRSRSLPRIAVPTLVIHGLADRLVNPSGGRALARLIPGARFVGIEGMGHDLPRALWPRFADEIAEVAARAEQAAAD